jgi:hypothetical protein
LVSIMLSRSYSELTELTRVTLDIAELTIRATVINQGVILLWF